MCVCDFFVLSVGRLRMSFEVQDKKQKKRRTRSRWRRKSCERRTRRKIVQCSSISISFHRIFSYSTLLHFDPIQKMFVHQQGGCDVVRAAMALHPGTDVVAFGQALLNVVSVYQEKYDDMKDVRI